MKKRLVRGLLVAVLAAGTASTAIAGTIFDNGAPVTSPPGWQSYAGSTWIADDFSLSTGATTLTDIHWWGSYEASSTNGNAAPYSDDFTIRIYGDNGNPSGAALHELTSLSVTRNPTALVSSLGQDIFSYSVLLDSAIALNAGTTYWLSIVNVANQSDYWVWTNSSSLGNANYTSDDAASWHQVGREMAFYLTDDAAPVPEPATLSLLGMGLAGLAMRARKNRKQG